MSARTPTTGGIIEGFGERHFLPGAGPRRVYVASSWRNAMQPAVVAALRAAKIGVYDFREPGDDGLRGFQWSDVMPSWRFDEWREGGVPAVPTTEYLEGVGHPLAASGFAADFAAMNDCDCAVLVLPCGRSAHLELGWFAGQQRPTAILLDGDAVIPELMYRLASYIAPSLFDLLGWLGVED